MLEKKQLALICLFLTAITLAVFWQLHSCDFIHFDDSAYVTTNQKVQTGVTLEGIRWAFTSGHAANWHPVTWISHMLDVQFFGLDPRFHHFTNLFLHLINTLLLFLVLHRMTKTIWRSAFVAAIFALHPLHVESVAWVAERKDVLSAFFWMLTLYAYALYVENRGLKRYLAVIGSFALGLMAKPMLVTLPFVLLLLDFWPLRRFTPADTVREVPTAATGNETANDASRKKSKRKHLAKEVKSEEEAARAKVFRPTILPLVREKMPLFALSALSCAVTFLVQQKGGAVVATQSLPLLLRIENALVSYVGYLAKFIWPNDLAILYPHPSFLPLWEVLGAALILAGITLTVIWKARSCPFLLSGWFWYTGALVPVIGIVQVGHQAMADRYTYIPMIGLLIMAGWGIPETVKRWSRGRYVLIASFALYLSWIIPLTWTQVGYWRSSFSLFDHTLEVTDNNWLIYNNRGVAYKEIGNLPRAFADFERAIAINPVSAVAFYNRGVAFSSLGNHARAVEDFDRALEIDPRYSLAYNYRGIARQAIGDPVGAIEDFGTAVRLDPTNAEAYANRGAARDTLGDHEMAIRDLNRAIELNPGFALAYNNRGIAYNGMGDYARAIEDYSKAIAISPEYAGAFYNRGLAHGLLGNSQQAVEDFRKAAGLGLESARKFLRGKGLDW